MAHLLHIDSSGRVEASVTRRLTARYARAWREHHPDGAVTHRDLVTRPLPHLDPAAAAAIWSTPGSRTAQQERDWALFEELLQEVERATTLLLGVPMYNFGVPSALKAWLDRVAGIPGRTLDVAGGGLLRDTDVVVVTARGGAYTPGTPRAPFDHQEPYLRAVFAELMGLTRVRFVHAEMTNATVFPALAPYRGFERDSRAAAEADIDAAVLADRA